MLFSGNRIKSMAPGHNGVAPQTTLGNRASASSTCSITSSAYTIMPWRHTLDPIPRKYYRPHFGDPPPPVWCAIGWCFRFAQYVIFGESDQGCKAPQTTLGNRASASSTCSITSSAYTIMPWRHTNWLVFEWLVGRYNEGCDHSSLFELDQGNAH
jgi:hypothetical protein